MWPIQRLLGVKLSDSNISLQRLNVLEIQPLCIPQKACLWSSADLMQAPCIMHSFPFMICMKLKDLHKSAYTSRYQAFLMWQEFLNHFPSSNKLKALAC